MELEPTPGRSPLDAILAEEGFIRALAKKLARDDEVANDVFQDTLLAAMKRPARPDVPVRSWIVRVIHNRVAQSHRRRVRREQHEALHEPEHADLSPAETAERDGLRVHVLRAIEEMDEPYRSAIVLRFYEDLEPRQMAERLGVPVETARTRVKRALAQLRARLDREYRGDTARWATALWMWTLPARSGIVAAPTGTSGARWASGLVAVIGCALLAWFLRSRVEPPNEDVASVSGVESRATELAPAASPSSGSERAQDPPQALPAVVLRVVRRDDGGAVAGARVRARDADGLERSTDTAGAATLPWPIDRELDVEIDATESTLASRAHLAPAERATLAGPWTITVEGSSEVAGRAIDRFGQAVALANVTVFALDDEDEPDLVAPVLASTTSDRTGRFQFDHLPRRFALAVESPERVAADLWLASFSRARKLDGLELVLDDPAPVAGTVQDGDGNAIAGAKLTFARVRGDADLRSSAFAETWFRARDEFEAESEYDGRFELARLPRGRYRLTLRKDGLATLTRSVLAPDSAVAIELESAIATEFVVADSAGEAVAGARATLRHSASSKRGLGGGEQHATSDAEGRIVASGAGAETSVWLHLDAAGFASALYGPFDVSNDAPTRRVALDVGRTLDGSVRDESGAPLAGVLVLARAVAATADLEDFGFGHQHAFFELARTRADANGEFRFDALTREDVELEVLPAERAAPILAQVVPRGAERADLVLRSTRAGGVTLVGRVTARIGGTALEDFTVSALPSDTPERSSRVTTHATRSDGRFRLELDSSGDWIVTASAPGCASESRVLLGVESGVRTLVFELARARTLDVRVVDARGRPVPYATLAISDDEDRPVAVALAAHERRSALQVGPRGEARLVDVPADRIHVDVTTPFLREATRFELELAQDASESRTLVLEQHDVELPRRRLAFAVVAAEGETSALQLGAPPSDAKAWTGHVALGVRDAAGRVQLSFAGWFENGRLRSDANRQALYVVDGELGAVDNAWTQELRPNWGAAFGRDFFGATSPCDALPIPASGAAVELELEGGEVLRLDLPDDDGSRAVAVFAALATPTR
ncbi:MAG: sigma-70 family RNA polymerase sigma factor [Planctomycetes bacterium]|nr:sigma-70 family RNA polymerase sigma factor [Planctomycetota bacterium]